MGKKQDHQDSEVLMTSGLGNIFLKRYLLKHPQQRVQPIETYSINLSLSLFLDKFEYNVMTASCPPAPILSSQVIQGPEAIAPNQTFQPAAISNGLY